MENIKAGEKRSHEDEHDEEIEGESYFTEEQLLRFETEPVAAILVAWNEVMSCAVDAINRNLKSGESELKKTSHLSLGRWGSGSKPLLSGPDSDTFDALRKIRNLVAHGAITNVTRDDAKNYGLAALKLVKQLKLK